jgi:hypothetical protein
MNSRKQKTLIGAVLAIYMFLVCFNNLTDYNANFIFMSKVTSMEDIFSREANSWRSISSTWLHHLFYIITILTELIIAGFLWKGVYRMFRSINADADAFEQAKASLLNGISLGIVLWLGMFIGIAGEWFLMWQSKHWNAQGTAFSLSIIFLLVRLNIAQKEN